MSCGTLNVEPPSLENANMIGPWTYRPLCGLKMNRVQLTYTRSKNGLPACVSTPIHSLSFRVEGAVESQPGEVDVALTVEREGRIAARIVQTPGESLHTGDQGA